MTRTPSSKSLRLVPVSTLLLCTLSLAVLPVCSQSQPTVSTAPAPAKASSASSNRNFDRWEKFIAAYEETDRTSPPPKGGVLFLGSSTIRRWDTLAEDFPQYQVINRGFGGSHIVDSIHFAERIIFPYEPRMIVLRAGGCDLHSGKSPEQVFADYKAFVAKMRARLPEVTIVYIGTNPTIRWWSDWDKTKALNAQVEEYARTRPYLKYVEMSDLVLGPDGRPRPELFCDELHFNAEGYELLADRVRPFLKN